MIRSILFPVGDGAPVASAREFAFWLARSENAHILALAVLDMKAFEIPVLGTPDGFMPTVVAAPIQETQTLLDEMTAAAREHLERFAAECSSREISCSVEVRTGLPGELLAREAIAHDLVVMSRTGYSRAAVSQVPVEPLVTQVIRGSIRPVLVAGKHFPPAGRVQNILVAFDGSSHASRALAIAATISARPGVRCTLATVTGSEEEGRELLAPAEAYLCHHGLSPERQIALGSKPSEAICSLVGTLGADLLVMGAYGHSPIREVLFGSTTEHVLRQCECTVVLQS